MTSQMAESLVPPLLARLKSYPGFISHASGPIPGGYQVIEVWESPETHQQWVREVVVPAMQQAGLNQPLPQPQYLPIDRFVTR